MTDTPGSILWTSIIRTLVPYVVGAILSFFIGLGLPLDPSLEGALGAVLTAVLGTLYYVGARLLETYVTPKLGWLLLAPKAPAAYNTEVSDTAKHLA